MFFMEYVRIGQRTVSYTHLDVYKRQPFCVRTAMIPTTWIPAMRVNAAAIVDISS